MDIQELEEKMKITLSNLVESAEMSVKLKKEYPQHSARIKKYWADFAKHFISQVRKLEQTSGEEILSGHALSGFLKFIK